MKLTKAALDAIRRSIKNKTKIKSGLTAALGCSEGSVNRFLRDNKSNNDLTKAAALQVITTYTGLEVHEILEEVQMVAGATK